MMSTKPDPGVPRRRLAVIGRTLLLLPILGSTHRVIDVLAVLVGFGVACVVGFPVIAVTSLVAYGVGSALGSVGLSAAGQGVLILVAGIGGGLVITFLILVRLLRFVPTPLRELYSGAPLAKAGTDATTGTGEPAANGEAVGDGEPPMTELEDPYRPYRPG
ncbi:MAG TPA: hypothetical protein VEG29_05310 [Candidatus Binatia bacterium]|nr:hypothetical protein [Candidatus Binatia bacterium]